MPIIEGEIDHIGPVIDAVVRVPKWRVDFLAKRNLPPPPPQYIRLLVDTGSYATALSQDVIDRLSLIPVGQTSIYTPSTPLHLPHQCFEYQAELSLVANGSERRFGEIDLINAESWHESENVYGLIGRDVLARCLLLYDGFHRKFSVNF